MINKAVIEEFEKMFDIDKNVDVKITSDDADDSGYAPTAEQKGELASQPFKELISDIPEQLSNLKDKGFCLAQEKKLADIAIEEVMKITPSVPKVIDIGEKVKEQLKNKKSKEDTFDFDKDMPKFDSLDSHLSDKFIPEEKEETVVIEESNPKAEKKTADENSEEAFPELAAEINAETPDIFDCIKEEQKQEKVVVIEQNEAISEKAEATETADSDDESEEENSIDKMLKEPLENIKKYAETDPEKDFSEELLKFDKPFFDQDGNVNWQLKSPARMWDSFYARKATFIKYHLFGGPIPFNSYWDQLDEYVKINVASEVFDAKTINALIIEIDKLTERVIYIYGRASRQFAHWNPGIEYLKGRIARIEYLKPAAKQDGLIDEHMWDIIYYRNSLESLQNYADYVYKRLKSGKESQQQKLPTCYHKDSDKQIARQYAIKEEAQKEQHPYQFETIKEGVEVHAPDSPPEQGIEPKKSGFCDF